MSDEHLKEILGITEDNTLDFSPKEEDVEPSKDLSQLHEILAIDKINPVDDQPIEDETKPSDIKGRNFFKDAWSGLKSGVMHGLSGLAKAPSLIAGAVYDAAAVPQNLVAKYFNLPGLHATYEENIADSPLNPLSYTDKSAEYWREVALKQAPDIDMDIVGSLGNGDIVAAVYKLGVGISQTSPQILALIGASMMGVPQAGLGAIGASAAGSKYQDLEEHEDLSVDMRRTTAILNGTLEIMTEKLGSSKLVEDIINNPAGRQGLKQGFMKIIAKFVGTEAGEEFINSWAQDAVDKVLGVEPDLTWAQAVNNSFNSMFLGLGMGTGLVGLKLASQRISKPKVSEAIADRFNYEESKIPEIQDQMDIVVALCDQYNVDASIMASLMKIESDFSNIDHAQSTATGPLMVTNAALEDLNRIGVNLHNPIDTLEGKLEAGVRYFKMLRDHYGFKGDELIAAYFAGPTYVRLNGISEDIVENQISTHEYVSRWKEAHSTLLGIAVDPSESTAELGDSRVKEVLVDQPLETLETALVGLNDPVVIQKSLETIGYTVGDRGDALLSSIAQFKDDFGLDWATNSDVSNLDDSILSPEFKETLMQALVDRGETELLDEIKAMESEVSAIKGVAENQVKDETQNTVTNQIGIVTKADPGDYWQQYDNWLKEVKQQQKEVATKEMAKEIEAEQRDTSKANNLVKWYLNGMATTAAEAADLELFNKPARGDAINTTRVLSEPKVLKSLELLGRVVEQGDRTSYQEIRETFTSQFGDVDEDVNEMVDKLGLLKQSAERLKSELSGAPELVYGLREAVTSNGNALKILATEITHKSGDVSNLKKAKFIKLLQLQKSLTGTLKGIWRKVGQTMSQGNMFVSGKSFNILDMTEEHLKYTSDGDLTLQQFIKDAGGLEKITKIAEDIANPDNALADINAQVHKVTFLNKLVRSLVEYRSANLLRHIATLMRNVTSQSLNMAAEWGANLGAATLNLFQGKNAPLTLEAANRDYGMTYVEATKRFIGDLVGMVESFTKPIVSIQEAGEVIYGESYSKFNLLTMAVFKPAKFEKILEASLIDNRINIEQGTNHKRLSYDFWAQDVSPNSTLSQLLRTSLNNLGAILRLTSFSMLQVTDKPFSYGAYSSEIAGQLHLLGLTDKVKIMSSKERKAYLRTIKDACLAIRKIKTLDAPIGHKAFDKSLAENITVEEARKAIEGELTEGALEGLTEEMLKTAVAIDEVAMKHSKYMTWKDPFDSKSMGNTIENFLNKHPSSRVFIPFAHTPLKILQKGWRWSNPLARETRDNLRGHNGKRSQTQAFGQFAVTGSLIYWGFSLMISGMLTAPARNKEERERMNLAGTPPNSIKIGDKWIDYSQWIPFPGFFLSTASSAFREVYEAQNEEGKTINERIISIAAGTIQAIYQSIKNQTMLESIDRLQGALEGGYTDSYVNDFIKTLNPNYTFSRNLTNYNYGGINPLYQEYLQTGDGIVKRDLFGKPIFNYKTFMGSRVETESESPIRQELTKLKINLPKIRDSFNGIKLEPEQYQDLLRYFDEGLRAEDRMNKIVLSSRYKIASEDNKIRMLRTSWENLKYEAKMSLYKNQDYVEEYLTTKRAEQIKAQKNIPYTKKYIPGKPTGESLWDILKQGE